MHLGVKELRSAAEKLRESERSHEEWIRLQIFIGVLLPIGDEFLSLFLLQHLLIANVRDHDIRDRGDKDLLAGHRSDVFFGLDNGRALRLNIVVFILMSLEVLLEARLIIIAGVTLFAPELHAIVLN